MGKCRNCKHLKVEKYYKSTDGSYSSIKGEVLKCNNTKSYYYKNWVEYWHECREFVRNNL